MTELLQFFDFYLSFFISQIIGYHKKVLVGNPSPSLKTFAFI